MYTWRWAQGNQNNVYQDALNIRKKVFIEEQHVPELIEIDGKDAICYHLVGYLDNNPVATARVKNGEDQHLLKLQRVAIIKEHRHQGIGRLLMDEIEHWGRIKGYKEIRLAAQDAVIPFYQSLNYSVLDPDGFIEANIPHHNMVKFL